MRTVNGIPIRESLQELISPPVALVVVDVQNDFCHPDGLFARHGLNIQSAIDAVPKVIALVSAAQGRGVQCVFIRQRTEPDGKSDSPAWLRLKTRDGKSPNYTLPGSWGARLVDGLAPVSRDLVVEKYRSDAFLGTSLEALLRANGIESLIFVGTTTEGCLESTVRSASYRDFYITVVEDLVFGPNRDLHEGSLRFMRARYMVAPMSTIIETLGQSQRAKPTA